MEEQILKEVLYMLVNGIQECKSRKDKRILKEIKDYIESQGISIGE
jgi:hypothetical protein